MSNSVDHPAHYKDVVPGIEAIEVTKHFDFCKGNAIKYVWRSEAKGSEEEDLRKAIWYIMCELESLGVPPERRKPIIDVEGHPDYEVMRVHKEAADLRLEAVKKALLGDL